VLYPIAVSALSALFAAVLLGQYIRRRRPYQLIWTLALTMSALASMAYVWALPPTSSPLAFRAYYALGGALMPAWLGLGSVYLVMPQRGAERLAGALTTLSAIAAGAVIAAPLDLAALHGLQGGPGTGILLPGAWLPLTVVLNTLGVAAVVGVAVYSGMLAARRRGDSWLLGSNALIAAGDLVVGAAGAMARTGRPELFWVTMLAGWAIIFAGFMLAGANRRFTPGSRPDTGRHSQPASPARA